MNTETERKDLVSREEDAVGEPLAHGEVFVPPFDIFENEQELLLVADLPGVVPAGLNVRLEKRELLVEARREVGPAGEPLTYRRTFRVHADIDVEQVAAHLENGVLKINLPKSDRARTRQIPVNAG